MSGVSIFLTPEECLLSEILGRRRRAAGEKAGDFDLLVDSEKFMTHEIQGVAAEVAFAKYYNLYPPMDIGMKPNSADFVIGGKTIDVKQSKYDNARLIVPPYKLEGKGSCDSYVLITGEMPQLMMQGYARREDLCNPNNLVSLRSLVYALSVDKLRPMPKPAQQ